jgi:hypothetical protein
VLAWIVVALLVGMVIGRTIRLRDRQGSAEHEVADEPAADVAEGPVEPEIPTQNSGGRERRRGR